jgi:PhnB protein
MAFYSYLFFSGNCREAFTRYQEIFGGELRLIAMSEAPPGEAPADAASADLIMHASLMNGDDLLMASDDPSGDGGGGTGFSVNFSTPDIARAREVFDQLSNGGEVRAPLEETFFSPAFGMCVDRFGIPWMVSADPPT